MRCPESIQECIESSQVRGGGGGGGGGLSWLQDHFIDREEQKLRDFLTTLKLFGIVTNKIFTKDRNMRKFF